MFEIKTLFSVNTSLFLTYFPFCDTKWFLSTDHSEESMKCYLSVRKIDQATFYYILIHTFIVESQTMHQKFNLKLHPLFESIETLAEDMINMKLNDDDDLLEEH